MMEFIFDTARAVTDLILGTLDRHPQLNVIVPHGGSALPLLADRASAPSCSRPRRAAARHVTRWPGCAAFTTTWPALLSPARFLPCSASSAPASCFTAATAPARGVELQIAAVNVEVPAGGASWQSLTRDNAVQLLPRMSPPSAA